MGWSNYGFPDPTMLSNYSPAMAIYLAHKERYELQSGGTYSQYPPEIFKAIGTTHYPFREIYTNNYINQFIDISQHPTDILWSATDMVKAIEDRDIYGIGEVIPTSNDAYKLIMGADWPVKLAQQAYLNMNLLKIGAVPHAYRLMGNGSSSGKSSPEEAYNAAVSNFHPNTNTFMEFETTIRKSSIYDDQWSCNITRPIIIEPTYVREERTPEVMQGLPSYLYANPRETSVFDAHGTGIIYDAGKYSRITLPYNSPTPAMPDAFSSGIYGPFSAYFVLDGITAVDFSSIFEFYDNVDEIQTS